MIDSKHNECLEIGKSILLGTKSIFILTEKKIIKYTICDINLGKINILNAIIDTVSYSLTLNEFNGSVHIYVIILFPLSCGYKGCENF